MRGCQESGRAASTELIAMRILQEPREIGHRPQSRCSTSSDGDSPLHFLDPQGERMPLVALRAPPVRPVNLDPLRRLTK